jgi:adenylate cyclase
MSGLRSRSARVRVNCQGREVVLDDSHKEITMGRAEENDVVVKGTLISRLHARIEALRDRFLLVDQSTNGTFVTNQEGKEAFVRRDSIVLQGRGYIGLGKAPDPEAVDVIRYQLED